MIETNLTHVRDRNGRHSYTALGHGPSVCEDVGECMEMEKRSRDRALSIFQAYIRRTPRYSLVKQLNNLGKLSSSPLDFHLFSPSPRSYPFLLVFRARYHLSIKIRQTFINFSLVCLFLAWCFRLESGQTLVRGEGHFPQDRPTDHLGSIEQQLLVDRFFADKEHFKRLVFGLTTSVHMPYIRH